MMLRLVFGILVFGCVRSEEEAEVGKIDSNRVYKLQHQIGENDWQPRGQVIIRHELSRSKMAQVLNAPILKEEESSALWSACFEKDSVYRIRALENDQVIASTSVAACDLFALRFAESLELQLDAQARLLSLAYRNLPASVSLPKQPRPQVIEFKSSAAVTTDLVAQIIPVQVHAPKPPGLKDATEPALGEDEKQRSDQKNKSFFAKYWHIIIPVTLLVLTAKGDPPAEGADGSQPSSASAPAAKK